MLSVCLDPCYVKRWWVWPQREEGRQLPGWARVWTLQTLGMKRWATGKATSLHSVLEHLCPLVYLLVQAASGWKFKGLTPLLTQTRENTGVHEKLKCKSKQFHIFVSVRMKKKAALYLWGSHCGTLWAYSEFCISWRRKGRFFNPRKVLFSDPHTECISTKESWWAHRHSRGSDT